MIDNGRKLTIRDDTTTDDEVTLDGEGRPVLTPEQLAVLVLIVLWSPRWN